MDTNNNFMLITTNLRRMMQQGTTLAMGITDDEIHRALDDYRTQYQERLNLGYAHAEIIRGFYGTMREIYRKHIPSNLKSQIKCNKGCAHCCHINVDCGQGEVDLILDFCRIKNITIDVKRLTVQAPLGLEERPRSEYSACVFLGDDNECKIYEVRPLACRKYFVVSDPVKCDYKTNPQDQVHILPVLQMELIASAIANMQPTGSMSNTLLKTLMTGKF
jgi:Fe-S-cluster containining protein